MTKKRENKEKIHRVTTSIKIDPELWKEVKIHCIKNNIEVSQFIEDIIKKDLR